MENISRNIVGNSYTWTYTSGMVGSVTFTETTADWAVLEGPTKGESGSDEYLAKKVADGVYFVRWHEPKNKITVTLLINEGTKKVYGSIVTPGPLEFDEGIINTMSK